MIMTSEVVLVVLRLLEWVVKNVPNPLLQLEVLLVEVSEVLLLSNDGAVRIVQLLQGLERGELGIREDLCLGILLALAL